MEQPPETGLVPRMFPSQRLLLKPFSTRAIQPPRLGRSLVDWLMWDMVSLGTSASSPANPSPAKKKTQVSCKTGWKTVCWVKIPLNCTGAKGIREYTPGSLPTQDAIVTTRMTLLITVHFQATTDPIFHLNFTQLISTYLISGFLLPGCQGINPGHNTQKP